MKIFEDMKLHESFDFIFLGLDIYLVTLVDVDNNLGRMTNNKNHNYSR